MRNRPEDGSAAAPPPADASILAPLREPVFRELWLAGVVSNVGTWMQNVGGAWFMAELTTSATMIALMQTATSLPVFLVGLPAGALADVVDRRRLLLVTQLWMLLAATILALFAFGGRATPALLLGATFALGLGSALGAPAWQAMVPEVVPARALGSAVALSSVSVNIARALGPALAGLTLAAGGAGWVFLLNALSFVAVIFAVWRWKRTPPAGDLPVEDFGGAIRAGWRYVRHSGTLHSVLVRSALFVFPAAALWSLMPVVARQGLGFSALGFSALQGSLGLGALVGATLLPKLRIGWSAETIASAATAGFGIATLALGVLHGLVPLCAMMLLAGFAWVAIMAGFSVSVLTGAPRWVQARAVAVFMLVFQGGMAIGSASWGAVAEHFGDGVALTLAAATFGLGLVVGRRFPLPDTTAFDLSPGAPAPDPVAVTRPGPDDGPVLVLVEYRVSAERAPGFLRAMQAVRPIRLRDGAIRWDLFRDPADPDRYLEAFTTDSWAEHLRQHQRVTVADRIVIDLARAFHEGEGRPTVSHFVAEHIDHRREPDDE